MAKNKKSDKQLGLNSKITRRDFVNSTLMGIGGTLLSAAAPISMLSGCGPKAAPAIEKDAWTGFGAVGDYTNSSGNTKAVMEAAHKIRDGFYQGKQLETNTTEEIFDVIIVGGGMSGLGAAHHFKKSAAPNQTCLLLENHPIYGGEAKRNEFLVDGQLLMGPQGSNDFGVPAKGSGNLTDKLFEELKIPRTYDFQEWSSDLTPLNFGLDNYAHMTGVAESKVDIGYYFKNGEAISKPTWFNNIWRDDLANAPYSEDLKKELLKWRYFSPENKGLEFSRMLDSMTYKEYLENELKFSSKVTEYIDPVIGLINGAGSDVISAFAASQIGMPATGRSRGKDASLPLSFPGGNTTFSRFLVKDIIPGSIGGNHTFEDITNQKVNFPLLDQEANRIKLRMNATVISVEHDGGPETAEYVKVIYEKGGKLFEVKSKSVIMASGGWVNKHIIKDLTPEIKQAYSEFTYAPALIANVALTNWRFMYKLGITAAQWFGDGFGFSCNIRKTMNIGTYAPPLHPDKPAILTFYFGAHTPGLPLAQQNIQARMKVFGTTFFDYEKQLRTQLLEQFGASGFDPEKDIAGITLNRWGHARITQGPGFYFGKDGQASPREVVQKGYGRIIFGHSELNGHQNWIGGVTQGYEASEKALALI
jgi:spermidine dehydrogenase